MLTFTPKLFTTLREGYSGKILRADAIVGANGGNCRLAACNGAWHCQRRVS